MQTWFAFTAVQYKVRTMNTWQQINKFFTKWRKRYYLKLKELELRYRPLTSLVQKRKLYQQYFSLWYEYYDTKYDIPRARLEYHFQQRNYKRSVDRVFQEWSYYTQTEDIDSNRPWIIHGYQRLLKARAKLFNWQVLVLKNENI